MWQKRLDASKTRIDTQTPLREARPYAHGTPGPDADGSVGMAGRLRFWKEAPASFASLRIRALVGLLFLFAASGQ